MIYAASPKAWRKANGRNSMKARRIIFRILIILIIGVVLGSVLYTINAKRVMHNELPMPLGFGVSVVLTGSMEPTLKPNDLVVIVKADKYDVGDIVVYQKENELIIHRIVMISGDQVVTQGDNNNTADEPFLAGNIKGKMKFSIPFVGLIVRGLKSTPGVIIILALAFFLMYRSWQSEKNEGESELDDIKEQIRKLKSEIEANGGANSEPDAENEAKVSEKTGSEPAGPDEAQET